MRLYMQQEDVLDVLEAYDKARVNVPEKDLPLAYAHLLNIRRELINLTEMLCEKISAEDDLGLLRLDLKEREEKLRYKPPFRSQGVAL